MNWLIGLSYLVANRWKFTNETPDAEIEEMWAFYSDSVRVLAQNLDPEPDTIDTKVIKPSTLDFRQMMLIYNLPIRPFRLVVLPP